LTAEQQALLDRLSTQCPALRQLRKFAAEFRTVFEKGERAALRAWMTRARQSEIGSLARFATGLEKDFTAVLAAVETNWSNGQVE
jgi:transposase